MRKPDFIDPLGIGYIDDPSETYNSALNECRVPAELVGLTKRYSRLFPDAYEQAKNISNEEFLQFRKGLRSERAGKFAGEAFMHRFGAILMPAIMLQVAMVAEQFGAPWGLAFCRLKEIGKIEIKNKIAHWVSA